MFSVTASCPIVELILVTALWLIMQRLEQQEAFSFPPITGGAPPLMKLAIGSALNIPGGTTAETVPALIPSLTHPTRATMFTDARLILITITAHHPSPASC